MELKTVQVVVLFSLILFGFVGWLRCDLVWIGLVLLVWFGSQSGCSFEY